MSLGALGRKERSWFSNWPQKLSCLSSPPPNFEIRYLLVVTPDLRPRALDTLVKRGAVNWSPAGGEFVHEAWERVNRECQGEVPVLEAINSHLQMSFLDIPVETGKKNCQPFCCRFYIFVLWKRALSSSLTEVLKTVITGGIEPARAM